MTKIVMILLLGALACGALAGCCLPDPPKPPFACDESCQDILCRP